MKYDFYHTDNILIWDDIATKQLDKFLTKPYHKIDEQIRMKYSFGNWTRYILNLPPYQIINLPNTTQS